MKEFVGKLYEGFIKTSVFVGAFGVTILLLYLMGIAKLPKNCNEYSEKKVLLDIVNKESDAYSYDNVKNIKMQDAEKVKKDLDNTKANLDKTKKDIENLNKKLK